jgi:hypothetical protein
VYALLSLRNAIECEAVTVRRHHLYLSAAHAALYLIDVRLRQLRKSVFSSFLYYKLFPMLKIKGKSVDISQVLLLKVTHNFFFVKASHHLLGFPSM